MTPDPLTVAVASSALKGAVTLMGKKVLGRWSDHRTTRFVEEFVKEVGRSLGSADPDVLEEKLSQIVDDEDKSAALYEAFRHVLLSASRDLGPRVLALHMIEVVAGLVKVPEISDAVMAAASALHDLEFEQFVSFAQSHSITDQTFADSCHHTAIVKMDVVIFEPQAEGAREPTGPIPLRSEVGSWALKFQNVGLLEQDVSTEYVEEGSAQSPYTYQRIHRNLELREGTTHFLRLSRLAIRSRGGG